MQNVAIAEIMVREKFGLPPEWKAVEFECLPRSGPTAVLRMRGGVYPPKKSGINKGRPNYRNGIREIEDYISFRDLEEYGERWQRETGNCNECMGSGQVLKSWHHIHGTTFKPCSKCRGTGKIDATKGKEVQDEI
jgi:hypothetical protein